MRKTLMTALLLAASLSVPAAAATPATLRCQKLRCYDVEKPVNAPTWCQPGSWESILLVQEDPKIRLVVDGGGQLGQMYSDKETVKMDFSDGDQYSSFSVSAQDLAQLRADKKKEITVTYTDGFGWSDGDHVRFKMDYVCRL